MRVMSMGMLALLFGSGGTLHPHADSRLSGLSSDDRMRLYGMQQTETGPVPVAVPLGCPPEALQVPPGVGGVVSSV